MSHSFRGNYLGNIELDHSTMTAIAEVYEHKGMADIYKAAKPGTLEQLRLSSIIESADHSNRIEGVFVPKRRLKALSGEDPRPLNRDESEFVGYKVVLENIHKYQEKMSLTQKNILAFHGQLMNFTPEISGKWKNQPNIIAQRLPDGTLIELFRTVAPEFVEQEMKDLTEGFNAAWQDKRHNRLVLIAAYLLDFLCIHPFADGNGRTSRLIALLLLYKAGFQVVKYISLERIIDKNKYGLYESLGTSDDGWHESQHNLKPWLYYLTQMILETYQTLESRLGLASTASPRSSLVMDTVSRMPLVFRTAEIIARRPEIPEQTIRNVLSKLGKEGLIRSKGKGRGAIWQKTAKL